MATLHTLNNLPSWPMLCICNGLRTVTLTPTENVPCPRCNFGLGDDAKRRPHGFARAEVILETTGLIGERDGREVLLQEDGAALMYLDTAVQA